VNVGRQGPIACSASIRIVVDVIGWIVFAVCDCPESKVPNEIEVSGTIGANSYKQATQGDATGQRPGGFDFVRAAKFDAWREIKGTSAGDGMQQYIDLVASLRR